MLHLHPLFPEHTQKRCLCCYHCIIVGRSSSDNRATSASANCYQLCQFPICQSCCKPVLSIRRSLLYCCQCICATWCRWSAKVCCAATISPSDTFRSAANQNICGCLCICFNICQRQCAAATETSAVVIVASASRASTVSLASSCSPLLGNCCCQCICCSLGPCPSIC